MCQGRGLAAGTPTPLTGRTLQALGCPQVPTLWAGLGAQDADRRWDSWVPTAPHRGTEQGTNMGGEQSTSQSTSAPPQQGFLPGAHTADPRGAEAPAHTQQRAATMGPHPHAVPPRCPCPIPGGATHPPLTQSQNIGRAAINNPARHKAISVPPAGGMRAREKALKYRHGLHRPLCHRWHTVGLIWGPQIPKLSPCGDKEGDEQLSPLAPAHK